MQNKNLNEILTLIQKQNENPKIELEFTNELTLLIAIILSAQTTDKNVNKATQNLFKIASSTDKFLHLGENKLKEYIKTLSFFNNKAKNIIKLCEILKTKYNNKIPTKRDILETLPGIGRKTANVFLNTFYKMHYIGVDTHVFRIANRISLAKGKTPLEIERKLETIIPEKFKTNISHQLVLFGRYICTAKTPKCQTCPILKLCKFKNKNI